MSEYFDASANRITANTRARSSHINDLRDELSLGFEKLPTPGDLQKGSAVYGTDSGTANTYAIAMPTTATSYTAGMHVRFQPSNENTGASTLNVDGLGAKAVKFQDGTDLQAGDLKTSGVYDFVYDGTRFVLVSIPDTFLDDVQASETNAAASETAAGVSETNAAASETAAATSASNAAASESAAATSASNAASSASAAATSETNAAASETAAGVSETNAAASETAAGVSETNAAASETAAGVSETNAAASETAAGVSETNAAASETAAATSESNAAASETAAATSASNAAASESAAATSASNAASYEADALGYSQNAASSASSASTSADEAASSATSASQSEQAAASSANYAGIWSNLTGSLSIPASVYHNGIMWTLLNNLTDVTTSEPTTSSSDWLAIYGMLEYPSIRPSLLLDFYSKEIDPRITFSRASNKSYYDHKGRLCYADVDEPTIDHDPVTGECKGLSIWGSRTNLLTYSEDFDNAAWVKYNATVVPNAITAPDGTMTADKLVEDTANTNHGLSMNFGTLLGGTDYTISVHVQAGERRYIRVLFSSGLTATYPSIIVDLLSGSVVATANIQAGNYGVEELSSGHRVWFSVTSQPSPSSCSVYVRTLLDADTEVYQGDGTSGIYIWGAQLEEGSSPSPYIPSDISFTSRASTALYYDSNGYIQIAGIDEPRYNYNPADLTAPPKLLLEDSSTNLLAYSEEFDNAAWSKNNSTITPDVTTAPDGTLTADKLQVGSSTFAQMTQNASLDLSVASTLTVRAKKGEITYLQLRVRDSANNATYYKVLVNLTTSVITGGSFGDGAYIDGSVKETYNGFIEVSMTGIVDTTGGAGTAQAVLILMRDDATAASTSNSLATDGLYVWGVQLEQSAYPTSYIPTTSAPVTRAADISTSTATTRAADVAYIDGTDFTEFYNQSEGTVVVGALYPDVTDNYHRFVSITDGTTFLNSIQTTGYGEGITVYSRNVENTVNLGLTTVSSGLSTGDEIIVSATYSADKISATTNGDTVISSANSPLLGKKKDIRIGCSYSGNSQLNGHIRHLSYYPKALTDNNLIALTTEE
jgi:hypothetical protein